MVRYVLSGLRDLMIAPERVVSDDPSQSALEGKRGGLVLDSGHLDAAGNVVPNSGSRIAECGARGNDVVVGDLPTCYRDHGLAKSFADYIPGEAATSMHLLEGAIFLGLAVLLVLGTVWAVRRQV